LGVEGRCRAGFGRSTGARGGGGGGGASRTKAGFSLFSLACTTLAQTHNPALQRSSLSLQTKATRRLRANRKSSSNHKKKKGEMASAGGGGNNGSNDDDEGGGGR
jgi:hypothetical protein